VQLLFDQLAELLVQGERRVVVGLLTGCRRGNDLVIAVQRCASYHSNIDPLVLHSIEDHSTLDLHSTANALCSTYKECL